MHKEMVRKIHANHFGAESNIRMVREVLFWAGMRKSIQEMCDACGTCAQHGKTTPKEPMRSLPAPSRPWQIVSQDIYEIHNQSYLVTVCHFSDWIEVDKLGGYPIIHGHREDKSPLSTIWCSNHLPHMITVHSS